jgi:hypothetical protein
MRSDVVFSTHGIYDEMDYKLKRNPIYNADKAGNTTFRRKMSAFWYDSKTWLRLIAG